MLKLSFESSPDVEVVGEFFCHYDQVLIGQSEEVDIYIGDDQVHRIHLDLFVLNKELYIKSYNEETYFYLNEKKIQGHKKISKGDQIRLGATIFKIVDFDQSHPRKNFEEELKKLLNQHPEIISILEDLEKEIIRLDNRKDG